MPFLCKKVEYKKGKDGVVVRAFGKYWGGIRFESQASPIETTASNRSLGDHLDSKMEPWLIWDQNCLFG